MVLAAHYVTGGFSEIGPLLSVPVFVIVLGIIMVLFPNKATRRTRRTLLLIHASLLVGFLVLGAGFGPFTDPDSGIAVSVGMIGVAAMATQNALVRLELPGRGARLTFPSVAGFVAGCAAGGFLELHFGLGALVLPVVLAAIAIPLGELVKEDV